MFLYFNILQVLSLIRYIFWRFFNSPTSIFLLHDWSEIFFVKKMFTVLLVSIACSSAFIVNIGIHLEEELAMKGKSKVFEPYLAIRYPQLSHKFGISKSAID